MPEKPNNTPSVKFNFTHKGEPLRLDRALAREISDISRNVIQRLIERGDVLVNDERQTDPNHTLRTDDNISLNYVRRNPTPVPLEVIAEESDFVVFNKPSGILTHPRSVIDEEFTIADAVKPKLINIDPAELRAGIVHRLDRSTSGVLVAARTEAMARHLKEQFQKRKVEKFYVALVTTAPSHDEFIVDMPIRRHHSSPAKFEPHTDGKPAKTIVRTIGHFGSSYALALQPITGRTHQLRVHLAKMGLPIIGDTLYAGVQAPRLMLHSYRLSFSDGSGKARTYHATIPSDISEYAGEALQRSVDEYFKSR